MGTTRAGLRAPSGQTATICGTVFSLNVGYGQLGKVGKGLTMAGKILSRRLWRLLAVGFILAAVLAPAAAWAYPDPTTSAVPPTQAAQVKAASASSGSSSLPVTGGDIAGLVAIGGGLVVLGVVLRRARDRRPSGV